MIADYWSSFFVKYIKIHIINVITTQHLTRHPMTSRSDNILCRLKEHDQTMPLHLIKLSVGTESPETLRQWQAYFGNLHGRIYHTTRMTPKRKTEILAGGSIYWVIKGAIRARQRVVDLEDFIDDEGIKHCRIVLDPELLETRPWPHRAFQGWRYLTEDKCPPDENQADGAEALPEDMADELRELGLI